MPEKKKAACRMGRDSAAARAALESGTIRHGSLHSGISGSRDARLDSCATRLDRTSNATATIP